mmetsp:Transcript_4636/g.8761  ORF Transcript_4636/g.8761 Transcript_4636/m.8761 type:complete len:207 (-) Transcript_4636:38-658(-)
MKFIGDSTLPFRLSQTLALEIQLSTAVTSTRTRACCGVNFTWSRCCTRRLRARPSTTWQPNCTPSNDMPALVFGGRFVAIWRKACNCSSWCIHCLAISTRYVASVFRLQHKIEPGKTSMRTIHRSSKKKQPRLRTKAPGMVKRRARQMLNRRTNNPMMSTTVVLTQNTIGDIWMQLRNFRKTCRHTTSTFRVRRVAISHHGHHGCL